MHIETSKRTIAKSQKEVYEFLCDLKNFEQLMPDSISKFELIDSNRFLFQLSGMPEIVLERKQQSPNHQIVLGAASGKLPFTLTADINALGDDQSEVAMNFNGEFNAMMAMMIKTPITNFMNTLADNLRRV
ncbi:SRPBCC family protein [Flavobacteriaceae bacterium TP-CH-4]|uniref:SRPBCC family protein n=1 Tax=Pelagihabitans pacificus TaxID=2696054 RepID=A0A967AVK6_9FLAO|nr:SRPBCC family protein [Pelagihabitans pacificus]NHF60759.1 SRPBCC family protein [Pelagihabitans pacificus]